MNKTFLYFNLIFFLLSGHVFANGAINMSVGTGFSITNFDENPNIASDDPLADPPASGSFTNISLNLGAEYFLAEKHSLAIGGSVPFIQDDQQSTILANLGYRYFFSGIGAPTKYTTSNVVYSFTPKMNYFLGAHLAFSSDTYRTLSNRKQEQNYGLGVEAGLSYYISKNMYLRGNAEVYRLSGNKLTNFIYGLRLQLAYFLK